jgi:hypothetical protein
MKCGIALKVVSLNPALARLLCFFVPLCSLTWCDILRRFKNAPKPLDLLFKGIANSPGIHNPYAVSPGFSNQNTAI